MFVGFDIGGTTIKYGIVNDQGEILEKAAIPTEKEKTKFLENLISIVEAAREKYPIEGVGISAPGIIQRDGYMLTAGAIRSLYGSNIKTYLEEQLQLPVTIENDANAAAIAEKWLGNAKDLENYLCMVLGTGIGGGIVINGQVYRGAHGMAGEFGWTLIDRLPETGDLETVSLNQRAAVVGGLCVRYNRALKEINPQVEASYNAKEIFQRESTGEELAHDIIEQFLTDLSVGLLNLISCFDPEAILVGGGISANEEFQTRLQARLEELKTRHTSIDRVRNLTIAPVSLAKLKNDAGLIGAVYQIKQKVQKEKQGI